MTPCAVNVVESPEPRQGLRGPDANENNVIVSWNRRPSRETWLAGNPAADTVVGHGSIETELQAGDSACSWRYCHGLDFLVGEIGPCAAVGWI